MVSISLNDILTDALLYEAWAKVKANKGCAGTDRQSIEGFQRKLDRNLSLLRQEVLQGTYQPKPLLIVRIPKKGGTRTLAIPSVRDRVLQTAVALALTPIFEAQFEDCSFAYRKNRSVDKAVERIAHLRNQGFQWVVDADIKAFFDNVDHLFLLEEVRKYVHDQEICSLIKGWLQGQVVDGQVRYCFIRGIPQGSPISPLLANLYLDDLDEELLEKDLKLVRFADDFIILTKRREAAQEALELTEEILEALKLRLHKEKTRVVNFSEGFRFLGVQFIRSLAFKTKSEEEPEGPLPERPGPVSPLPPKPVGITEEAFREAGLQPPSSDLEAVPSDIGPGEFEEALPSGHDPRLRTLYLFKHGCVLAKKSERFVIRHKGKVIQEVPAIKVDQIMVFGNGQITTQAMHYCLSERIPIFLLSSLGRFYGVIDSFDTEPVLLHRTQFATASDMKFCLRMAKAFVQGKISNSKIIILRYARKRWAPKLKEGAEKMKTILSKLGQASSLEELRGLEGAAARAYFTALAQTIPAKWRFNSRKRHPPTDPVNSMLSYGYTLLFYNIYTLLRARGLNPHVGYLHPMRAGHPALVSDLMEEFRAIIVDTVVLNLVLNDRISPKDFSAPGQYGCLLEPQARKRFLMAFENKLNSRIRHPLAGQRLDYRRCIEYQANLLARTIRGIEKEYQPMTVK